MSVTPGFDAFQGRASANSDALNRQASTNSEAFYRTSSGGSTGTRDSTGTGAGFHRQSTGSSSRSRAQDTVSREGVVSKEELRGWYVYDLSFSPYWQVADIITKWVLKRLAEYAENAGSFKLAGMSTGSYPAAIMFVTSGMQVVCLLTFSTFGDYGKYRKLLLILTTYMCCTMLIMCYFCTSADMWWFAGLLRIFLGCSFVLTNVYYNAYLPLLTSQHPDVLALQGEAAEKREIDLADEISSKGFGCGYLGGATMQLIAYLILLVFECKSNCSYYDRLRWTTSCIALCGFWWGSFALYSFRNLKTREACPFPANSNIFCLGWQDAYVTLRGVMHLRNTWLFVIGYFIWSDALTTTINVACLQLDDNDDEGLDSSKFVLLIGATVSVFIGVVLFRKIQRACRLSSKAMLMGQICFYGALCTVCACGGLKRMYYGINFLLTLMLGSFQAYQRSLYSNLAPVGKEASMFSFYAITDKGSSLIGYAVICVVHTYTHSYLGSFWYCAAAFFLSAFILSRVDMQAGMRDAGKGG